MIEYHAQKEYKTEAFTDTTDLNHLEPLATNVTG